MKLSKYLADYIKHEKELDEESNNRREYDIPDYEGIIQQGIEAYMSTENNTMILISEDGKQATIKLEE